MIIGSQVLVTGASGFIGHFLSTQLKRQGKRVRSFSFDETPGPWDESVVGDLASGSLPDGCMSGVDTVIHLAGKAHALSESPAEEAEYYKINTEGTRILLDAAAEANVQRFVFFSSVKASGEGGKTVLDEDCQLPPETPYGHSKLAAEELVLNSTIPHVSIIRPVMVYGPGNPGNLGRMISGINKGYFLPFPEIKNSRSMLHVEDVVQAALLAAFGPKANKQIYIVTDGQSYSTRQIYEWICQALDKSVPNWSVPLPVLQALARFGDGIGALRKKRFMFDTDALDKLTGSAVYSSAKIQKELSFSRKWTLDQALPAIVNSYLKKS